MVKVWQVQLQYLVNLQNFVWEAAFIRTKMLCCSHRRWWSSVLLFLFITSFYARLFWSYSGAECARWLCLPAQRQGRTVIRLFCNIRYLFPGSFSNTHTFHLSCSIYLFLSNTHTCIYIHMHPDICTVILRCSLHIPAQFPIISWYAAPSTGSPKSAASASPISAPH